MTEDTKLILEIIVPIIILLIMFCVMCWNKAITILIIVGFIITAAITLIAQIPDAKDKIIISETRIQLLRTSIYKQEEKLQIITQR